MSIVFFAPIACTMFCNNWISSALDSMVFLSCWRVSCAAKLASFHHCSHHQLILMMKFICSKTTDSRVQKLWQEPNTAVHGRLLATPFIHTTHNDFVAIIQVNLCQMAPPVKNWRVLSEQSFTACTSLLVATSVFRLSGKTLESLQQCYRYTTSHQSPFTAPWHSHYGVHPVHQDYVNLTSKHYCTGAYFSKLIIKKRRQ